MARGSDPVHVSAMELLMEARGLRQKDQWQP